MARTSKTSAEKEIEEKLVENANTEEEVQVQQEVKEEEKIPESVLALMKLYPQYEEMYVTPTGFVHPKGTPEYARKGAKLYKNKFFNK